MANDTSSGPGSLGYINYVESASGLNINLENATGVTFVSFLDAGTQTVTLQETDSAGGSDQNLAILNAYHKAPNGGGTWTKVTQNAAATINLTTDATNDCFTFYVDAEKLSDGFTCLEATADSGVLHAIIHLKTPRAAVNLPTPIV